MPHFSGSGGDLDRLQANNPTAARQIKVKQQPTVKTKQQLNKTGVVSGGALPTTNVFQNPQTLGFLSQQDFQSGLRDLRADIASQLAGPKQSLNVPIQTGLGAAGGVAATIGVSAAKLLLKAPGTRQVIQRLAGRASTLQPFRGGPTIAAIGAATGIGITADAIISGGGQALDKIGGGIQRRTTGGFMPAPGTGRSMARLPGVGGQLPAGTTIVKTWHTGTAAFARLADGRIAVQRKDGTIKTYRPQKHIVIPRNPRVGTLIRADKRLDRLTKGLRKVVRTGKR